jgi:hypothetical protein
MPIVFPELENILLIWKKTLNIKKPIRDRTGKWVYNNMKNKADKTAIKNIVSLFENIDIDNVIVSETINTDRTYGKLTVEKNIIINNNKSSL